MQSESVRCWTKGGPQNKIWNWGDAISPAIFEHIAGYAPQIIDYTEMSDRPHLMICGSTLKWVTSGSILWGVGEIAEGMKFLAPDARPLHVAAIRGPLTRKRLRDAGISCPEVYCDPALVWPVFYKPKPKRRYRLGLIPHYVDQNIPSLDAFRHDPDVKLIDITQSDVPEESRIYAFIDDVCSCDVILSSSLHGLILADAYAIPCKWMLLSEGVFGRDFKFRDYFLSVGQEARARNPLTSLGNVDEIVETVLSDFSTFGKIKTDLAAFLSAFPGKRKDKSTDISRWIGVALRPPPWDRRNELIAGYIPQDCRLLEFGAGNQTLQRHIRLKSYTPVDCVATTANVFVCDYNREHRFPDIVPDVIVMSGFLEYIRETEAFLVALRLAYPGARCLFSWAFEPNDISGRLRNGWIANLNPAQPGVAPFDQYFRSLRILDEYATSHSRQLIYEGFL